MARPSYVIYSATVQKMKYTITDLFSKCNQICSFLQIWSHLLKKSVSLEILVGSETIKTPGEGLNHVTYRLYNTGDAAVVTAV